MKSLSLVSFGVLAAVVSAQQAQWAQCGGIGWTGGTTCVAGTTCTQLNAYYYQCLASTGGQPTTTTAHITSTTARITTTTAHTTTTTAHTTNTTSKTTTSTQAVQTSSNAGGYLQVTSGSATFTEYVGCGQPACGIAATGFTAAVSQLTYGAPPGLGPGDACGRCFALTATADPYSPAYTGPFNSVIVRVTDECPVSGNQAWCGQTRSNPVNTYGASAHFDLCQDTGAAQAFFPSGHTALKGSFTEVSCSQWSGSSGSPLWTGACLAPTTLGLWPAVGCGNQGTAP